MWNKKTSQKKPYINTHNIIIFRVFIAVSTAAGLNLEANIPISKLMAQSCISIRMLLVREKTPTAV